MIIIIPIYDLQGYHTLIGIKNVFNKKRFKIETINLYQFGLNLLIYFLKTLLTKIKKMFSDIMI